MQFGIRTSSGIKPQTDIDSRRKRNGNMQPVEGKKQKHTDIQAVTRSTGLPGMPELPII